MIAILAGLFCSVILNVFLAIGWRRSVNTLKHTSILRSLIEKSDSKHVNKKGIITVTRNSQGNGANAPALNYDVDIEIEELERYANGKSLIKTVRILGVRPPVVLFSSEEDGIMRHWNNKYVTTKNIDFLEKIDDNAPAFSEEDPNLIEKIEEKK